MAGKRWTNAEIEYLVSHRASDTIRSIALYLGRSIDAVQAQSLKMGLGYVNSNARPEREINSAFFKTWTPEMAYVFGYWLADGSMTRPEIRKQYGVIFVSKDEEHLQKIRQALKSTHAITNNNDGTHKLTVTRKLFWLNLYVLGGRPAKSLTVTWPDVPMKFIKDFLRGYIDGDGCLHIKRAKTGQVAPDLSITGTKEFLQVLSNIVYDLTGIQSQRVRRLGNSNAYEVRYGGVKAKCLADWVYSGAELYLDRKWEIYQEFMKWFPKQVKRKFISDKMFSLFKHHIVAQQHA